MRRPLLALALLLPALGATLQTASTASNALSVNSSTAVYRGTTVTGASAVGIDYSVTGASITGVTARLRGTGLLSGVLPKRVTARFGSGTAVSCTPGVITLLNAVTGLREGTWTCLGFAENAQRPRALTIAVG